MRRITIAPFVAAGLALSACTGSTDPRTATLFDNIQNIRSGEYDRQIAAKEAEAAAIVRANQREQAAIASLERQRSSNASTLASLRNEIAAVRRQAASARSALQADPAGNASELQRLASLEAQLNAVSNDANAGASPTVVRGELSRIRSAIRALSS